MTKPGEHDPAYLRARKVLLDALEVLEPHLEALVLVGAQAIYLHTGEGELALAPYTTDTDLAVAPEDLGECPSINELLSRAGFTRTDQPGSWRSPDLVIVDLMVPEAIGGPGSRAARLPSQGKHTARKAKGLEAALVDRRKMGVGALDQNDSRCFDIWVAGPAALLVAKLHKIGERAGKAGRQVDKDAHDVLRLLQRVPTGDLATSILRLRGEPISARVTSEALELLRQLFGTADAPGSQMAARATEGLADLATIRHSCAALASDLLSAIARA